MEGILLVACATDRSAPARQEERLDLRVELVTDQIISHLLAQVAVEPDLLAVFEELFTRGGAEIQFEPLKNFAPGRTDFLSCQTAALARGRLALGWRLTASRNELPCGLHLNPSRHISLEPQPREMLVTLVPEL